jgi:hypothetical protein
MKSATLPSFWDGYREQSDSVRQRARKDYRLWADNHDGTEYLIAQELIDLGVPSQSIVVAYARKFTEFAVV